MIIFFKKVVHNKFRKFRPQLETNIIQSRRGTQGENKDGDPTFLLQDLNVLYMAVNIVKSLKQIWIVNPFQLPQRF